MFLIDDYVNDSETPWLKLESTLEKLASIATVYDQDGVDLAFINSPNYYSCLNTAGDVMKAFRRTGPAHECTYTLKRRLEETLSAYVQRFKDDKFTKPLNLIIITSGDFVAHDQFEETVMDWAKELDRLLAPKSQLGLQFVLVGCKADNVKRFKLLDDKMFEDYGVRYVGLDSGGMGYADSVRDMVDATCYDPDGPENANLLENIMCGGMISALKIDRMQGLEEEDIDTLMED